MNDYSSLLKSILAVVGGSDAGSAAIKASCGAGILSLFIKLLGLRRLYRGFDFCLLVACDRKNALKGCYMHLRLFQPVRHASILSATVQSARC